MTPCRRIVELEAELAASKDQCGRLTDAFADAKRAQPQLRLAREELERVQLRLKEAETMIEDQGHQLAGRMARIEMLEQQLADAEVRGGVAHTPTRAARRNKSHGAVVWHRHGTARLRRKLPRRAGSRAHSLTLKQRLRRSRSSSPGHARASLRFRRS